MFWDSDTAIVTISHNSQKGKYNYTHHAIYLKTGFGVSLMHSLQYPMYCLSAIVLKYHESTEAS
jgi:hypothetical protein